VYVAVLRKAFRSETPAGEGGTIPLFAIDHSEIQVYRIVVEQLFELRGRYLMGVEVLLVLVISMRWLGQL
jgi:hypothetical protein